MVLVAALTVASPNFARAAEFPDGIVYTAENACKYSKKTDSHLPKVLLCCNDAALNQEPKTYKKDNMEIRKTISFHERYKTGQTPWEINRVDSNLVIMITEAGIKPCKALDIGCGTGDNSIWLTEQGFEVTGCDASRLAIEKAMEKSELTGVECSFYEADFLQLEGNTPLYSLLFDRGCFHCFDEPVEL